MAGNLLELPDGEPCDPFETRAQRTAELDLSAHRGIGDRGHFPFRTRRPGKHVDDLDVDKGRIHVEADEPPAQAPAVFTLHRDVNPPPLEGRPDRRPEPTEVRTGTARDELEGPAPRIVRVESPPRRHSRGWARQ